MFDNVLHQSASDLLAEDIQKDRLPGSILFSGPSASGKLTCALELSRVLSCVGQPRGRWDCNCSSCVKHRAMVSQNLLIAGPGNRTLEIAAAKTTLLSQNAKNTSHLEAARYLYLRAVRKLTARFSSILWKDDDKLSKFAPILLGIDENLELLTPGRTIPDGDELSKILDDIEKLATKLEASFLYDSLPVLQIRNFSEWAHLSTETGKKVLIIENADCMADSARNALLKILEEPPENTVFILTTSRRSSMLATILSRVRTYTFFERSVEQQREVINRVFHYDPVVGGGPIPDSINGFLQTYFPVKPDTVKYNAELFFRTIAEGHVPNIPSIVSVCGGFEPRQLFRIFMESIVNFQKPMLNSASGCEASAKVVEAVGRTVNNVGIYNQNPAAGLEELVRTLMQINRTYGGVFSEVLS
ncbi:MAG: DNA polymerase III [Treponema sp.]|nr:DNA polymerase III [Treponema sp.]